MRADQVIIKPIETEKTLNSSTTATLKVHLDASKQDVSAAIQRYYGFKPMKVRTLKNAEKTRFTKFGKSMKRRAFKKAIITLPEGVQLDINAINA